MTILLFLWSRGDLDKIFVYLNGMRLLCCYGYLVLWENHKQIFEINFEEIHFIVRYRIIVIEFLTSTIRRVGLIGPKF